MGLILAGAGIALRLVAPWGGLTYHEITLQDLTPALENSSKNMEVAL